MDETGYRVNGMTQGLHVASNEEWTYYHTNPQRKALLDVLTGTVVHDHWKPYYQLEGVKHALCNAHHLDSRRLDLCGRGIGFIFTAHCRLVYCKPYVSNVGKGCINYGIGTATACVWIVASFLSTG